MEHLGGGGGLLSQNINILGHAACMFQLAECVFAILNNIRGCPLPAQLPVCDGMWVSNSGG